MKTATTYLLIVAFATVAAFVPIVISYQIARQESLSFQTAQLRSLAADIAHRADETGTQFALARADLNSGKFGPPSSSAEIQHMRALALTSTYLQAVGRMSGTRLLCTSMGRLNPPVDLGPPDMTTVNGVRIWLNIRPVFAGGASFHALESQGCAVFIAPSLVLDIYSEQPGLSMAVVTGTARRIISKRGEIQASWLSRLNKAGAVTLVDDKNLVAIQRCKSIDVVSVVAQPITHTYGRMAFAAMIFVPIGAAIGLVMAACVFRTARKQHTLPYILKTAVRNREFFMHYQPIVELRTGRIIGAEALLRWRRVTGEMIRPDLFIPVAEEMGLIGKITEFVINLVMPAASRLEQIRSGFYVGLNITSADIKSGSVARHLTDAAARNNVDLTHIGIEITETGLLEGDQAFAALSAIRATGVKIAMDDFGTGFSSLAYLMKLNIDCLKIDRLFVDSIGTGSATSNVISHMIDMGTELRKEIIAEGVETQEQAQYLKERGVRLGQGFLFGRPMPLEELIALLEREAEPEQPNILSTVSER